MSEENEKKWRREFEESDHVANYQYELYKNKFGEYGNSDTCRLWLGFREACKKHQQEIDQLQNKLDSDNQRHAKRIVELEESLKEAIEVIELVYDTHEMCNQNRHNRSTISNSAMDKVQQFLEKHNKQENDE